MGFSPDDDLQRVSVVEEVLLVAVAELDPDLPAAEEERERELCPDAWQGGGERQLSVVVADTADSEDQVCPYAGGGGAVTPSEALPATSPRSMCSAYSKCYRAWCWLPISAAMML